MNQAQSQTSIATNGEAGYRYAQGYSTGAKLGTANAPSPDVTGMTVDYALGLLAGYDEARANWSFDS